jgi:putative DNA methylase
MQYKKKLIEVALPLEAINKESAREKSIRHGHPSTLHLWWARRPLAAARAVIWSSLVDDPSSHPDKFPTQEAQDKERRRLFSILEELVKWENSNKQDVLDKAKAEIMKSTNNNPPEFLDPFAGGGSIPLEAQRLGLKAHASDLNPVAVLINKAMIELPSEFAGQRSVNPVSRKEWGGKSKEEKQERQEREGSKERGEKEKNYGDTLQGGDSLEKINDDTSGDLQVGSKSAQRGNIRNAFPDNSSGNIHSSQYSGRVGTRIDEGESSVFRNCAGVIGGNGNSIDSLRTNRLVSECQDDSDKNCLGGNKSNINDHAQKISGKTNHYYSSVNTLFPLSSPLFPNQALAEDVRYYGQQMKKKAFERICHLYPKVKDAHGKERTVIAWLWTRTVKCPNPACGADMPLASSFELSKKKGKEAYVLPIISDKKARYEVKNGAGAPQAPKTGRGQFKCICCGEPVKGDYIKAEGKAT